ncbi:MAG: type II toxin-antitoxin system VapC family toxin [Acidobacteria bacterium]|nr:type II toxin-antitoxin system VapC family toxin [Acidobacteriota bacterium]MCB9399222.1 type II toxin-antitoxin system VapC family toxin [Acidobacteriota bacterium]
MSLYLLDTNTVSLLIRGNANMAKRIQSIPMAQLSISSITMGELYFGLAKRPQAEQLQRAVMEFLKRVTVFAWDELAAKVYGSLRAELQKTGKVLAPLDMLIAAHAKALNAILVSNDQAFNQVAQLQVEDWK